MDATRKPLFVTLRCRSLLRCRRGAAALEFAAVGALLALLLAGIVDFGAALYARGRLASGVTAGLEYAVVTGTSASTSTIQSIVTAVSGLSLGTGNPSVSISTYCVQGSPSALVATASGSTCSDGSSPGTYAVITATYTEALIMPLAGFNNFPLTESASVRLQ